MRRVLSGDEGTALLLTLGYALLALALVLVCADATSLYLAHKRADAAADAAALAGADGFDLDLLDGEPVAVLTDTGVYDQAEAIIDEYEGVNLVAAGSPDGSSAQVTVTVRWRAPILGLLFPDGVVVESTATSRTAFG
jgi:uncharacterized membrane protein